MTQPTTPPPTDIGGELALRAGVDPAWLPVYAVWLDGAAMYPQPFRNR